MGMMTGSGNLNNAKAVKNDEFYTQLADIERELKHYKKHFKGKAVLCNCDDPRISEFFHYFSYNFEYLGLKKLITTCYKNQQMNLFSNHNSEKAIWLEYDGAKNGNKVPEISDIGLNKLNGDGDFRSEECINLLKQADIVVTNPPFSLFREYVAQLIKYKKKFIILGNINASSYKDIFSLTKEQKIWRGHYSGIMKFKIPKYHNSKRIGDEWQQLGNICWFTNFDHKKRHEELELFKKYRGREREYPKYDNYDAINVDKVNEIPCDYYGVMGVPISFIDKHNPDQFEIIGCDMDIDGTGKSVDRGRFYVNGNRLYVRLLIKRKRNRK